MKVYLVQMCNKDGSTPLGECPTYEIDVPDELIGHSARNYAANKALNDHSEQEIVSIGLKSEIEAYNQSRFNR